MEEKALKFVAVLNRDGGTLRTTDLDALGLRMRHVLEGAGHSLAIDVVDGGEIGAHLEKAASRRGVDVVLAGGGDGTISTAAALLMNRKKALAVLPAGTMNLFARGLGIPASLDDAIDAFADGKIVSVDMASANGRPFVHQFSVGLHARMVHLREKMEFGSRLGKMRASLRASWMTLRNPPRMRVDLTVGEAQLHVRTTGIGISNNLFGEGHLPYADNPAGGVLGIYVASPSRPGEMLRFFYDTLRGRWRDSQHVEVLQGGTAVLTVGAPSRKRPAVMDGELVRLEPVTRFEIHPGALNVLVPNVGPETGARDRAIP
jgi:diacylglycerol kinase family enzyme